jgi:hypothetical protein
MAQPTAFGAGVIFLAWLSHFLEEVLMATSPTTAADEQDWRGLIKDLADSVSTQAEVANRMWLALITVAVFAIVPRDPTNKTVKLPFELGEVSPLWFHWLVFLILVVLAIAFAAAHAQQVRAQKFAQSTIDLSPQTLTGGNIFHLRDYFDMLRKPSLTRVASLAQVLRGQYQFFTTYKGLPVWLRLGTVVYYGLLKLVSLLIYFFLPIFVLGYAWGQVAVTGWLLWCTAALGIVAGAALLEVLVMDGAYAITILLILWRAAPDTKQAS